MPNNTLLLSGLNIHAEAGELPQGSALIVNKKIQGLYSEQDAYPKSLTCPIVRLPWNWHLIPGLIDIHIHGSVGVDVMDADPTHLAILSKDMLQDGVTSYVATTISSSISDIEKTLQVIRNYYQNQPENAAHLLGINLEGPFLSQTKIGAHQKEHILPIDINLFKHWQELSGHLIRMTTIAPEKEGAVEFISYLRLNSVIAAIGHTDANYDQANAAIYSGACHATHLFNAMRNLNHRDPGTVTALLIDDRVTVELIADGVHVAPVILQLAYKVKSPKKIILVSDAMRARGLADGEYAFAGQTVKLEKGVPRLPDGRLASSVLSLDQAMRNMMLCTNCSLETAVQMASSNPALALGIMDRKGSIALQKDADLVVLDEKHRVKMTICAGKIVFCAQDLSNEFRAELIKHGLIAEK